MANRVIDVEGNRRRNQNQFSKGMTWENYGKWHLDHVTPLASFDLTDRVQFLEACNWLNYQPLWAADNLKKGSK